MKKYSLAVMAFFAMLSLTSCELAGDIFEAGVWGGVLIVAVVLGLLYWLFAGRRK